MNDARQIKLYATQPHPCSYLDDRDAKTLFLDPDVQADQALYTALSQRGFRRSGAHLYRPDCEGCKQCIASRVVASEFRMRNSQRRVWRRNRDLRVELRREMDAQAYPLYARYIEQRHPDGDMHPPSPEQFANFLEAAPDYTEFFHFYCEDALVAVAVTDVAGDGLSAIYTFFEPTLERRSLGRFAILWQIHEAKRRGLPYLYLGYWIRDCEKMRYKIDYRPIELLMTQRWVRVN